MQEQSFSLLERKMVTKTKKIPKIVCKDTYISSLTNIALPCHFVNFFFLLSLFLKQRVASCSIWHCCIFSSYSYQSHLHGWYGMDTITIRAVFGTIFLFIVFIALFCKTVLLPTEGCMGLRTGVFKKAKWKKRFKCDRKKSSWKRSNIMLNIILYYCISVLKVSIIISCLELSLWGN